MVLYQAAIPQWRHLQQILSRALMLAAKKQSIESSPVNDAPRQGLIAHGLQSLRSKRRRPEETKRLIVEETDKREVEEVRSFRVKQEPGTPPSDVIKLAQS